MLAMANTNLSTWLNEQLIERGWSQAELARRAHVSRTAISDVISEKRNAGSDLCQAIAIALKVPADMVYQKAGLLPASFNDDPLTREADYLLSQMSPAQRDTAIKFMRFLANEGNAAPRTGDLADAKSLS